MAHSGQQVVEISTYQPDDRDVEQGLLDFPSKRFDEEVWLCWKVEESEIRFWHAKDEGFMGRKPLESTGVIEP